jgi:hypothetical protein
MILGLESTNDQRINRTEQPEPVVSKQRLRLQVSQQIPVQYTPMRLAGKHPGNILLSAGRKIIARMCTETPRRCMDGAHVRRPGASGHTDRLIEKRAPGAGDDTDLG